MLNHAAMAEAKQQSEQDHNTEIDGDEDGVHIPINHKRSVVVNHDNNIDLILAGRIKNFSLDVPSEPKNRNQRLQRIVMESENDFKHLLGEVDGEKYAICGRPELELITVGFPEEARHRKERLKVFVREMEEEGTDGGASTSTPKGVAEVKLLYCSSKTYFVYSPRHEDHLLALLKDHPTYETVITSARCLFGAHSFSTLDMKKQREWRRYEREFLLPQLINEERMTLMEDRLNFEILYEDDGYPESEPNSTDEEEEDEKVKKKRTKKRGKGAKKKAGADVELSLGTPITASKKEVNPGPSTSARVQQRMSSKKGIGLLAKRASTRTESK